MNTTVELFAKDNAPAPKTYVGRRAIWNNADGTSEIVTIEAATHRVHQNVTGIIYRFADGSWAFPENHLTLVN